MEAGWTATPAGVQERRAFDDRLDAKQREFWHRDGSRLDGNAGRRAGEEGVRRPSRCEAERVLASGWKQAGRQRRPACRRGGRSTTVSMRSRESSGIGMEAGWTATPAGVQERSAFDDRLDAKQREFWHIMEQDALRHTGRYVSPDLPLARVKRIMQDAAFQSFMIGADAPHHVTYLCEIFCRWLTLRAHHFATADDRRTLQLHDIVAGVMSSDQLDFLIDLVQEHGNVDAEYERQQQIELEQRLRFSHSKIIEGRKSSRSAAG